MHFYYLRMRIAGSGLVSLVHTSTAAKHSQHIVAALLYKKIEK